MGSYVTDITRSALYRGASETGVATFHLPKDNVHIVMDPTLHPGSIYKIPSVDENERFINYYLVASGGDHYWQDLLDDDDEEQGANILPDNTYALSVGDDLYRRLFEEVSSSQCMPCGLFFCGHHEDVDKPSIVIALVIVCLLLVGMGALAFTTDDLV